MYIRKPFEKPKKAEGMDSILSNPKYGRAIDKLVNHTVFADLYLKSNRHRNFWFEFGKPAFILGTITYPFFVMKHNL